MKHYCMMSLLELRSPCYWPLPRQVTPKRCNSRLTSRGPPKCRRTRPREVGRSRPHRMPRPSNWRGMAAIPGSLAPLLRPITGEAEIGQKRWRRCTNYTCDKPFARLGNADRRSSL